MSATSIIYQQRKSFATLYTGVFLIIITFVIGAFTSSHKAVEAPNVVANEGTGTLPKEKSKPNPLLEPRRIGELTIARAFHPDTNTLDISHLDGVLAALRAHDIGVRFLVRALEQKGSDASSDLIARLVSSHRWLESLGLPKGAYEVEGSVTTEAEAPELTVSFFGGVTE